MLTLRVKPGDKFKIGDDITLIVKADPGKGRLMIAIAAPKDVNIERTSPEKA